MVPTDDHITEIRERGFTVMRDVLDVATIARYRTELLRLYEQDRGVLASRPDDRELYHLENLPSKSSTFEDYFANPSVLSIAERLLGDDCILRDCWSLGIPPGGGRDGEKSRVFGVLHVDDPLCHPDFTLSLVTLYALEDTDERNGATRIVPNSNTWGRRPDTERHPDEVPIALPAGACLIFVGGIWHSSGSNESDRTRVILGAAYNVAWVKPFFDFTRSLPPAVVERATPITRRLFGFDSIVPYREAWMEPVGRNEPKVTR